MQHKIRYVHNVVYRTQADSGQGFLKPIRRLVNTHSLYAHPRIARAILCIFNRNFDRQVVVLYRKSLHARACQCNILTMCQIVSMEVACYAIVADSIRSIRGNIHLNQRIVLHVVVLLGRHTYRSLIGQNDNTCVVAAYANLVFRTKHTERFLTAYLTALDCKMFIAVI